MGEKVGIACHKHRYIEGLRLERQTWRAGQKAASIFLWCENTDLDTTERYGSCGTR